MIIQLHKAPLAVHELLDKSIITGDIPRKTSWDSDSHIDPQKFAVREDHYQLTDAYEEHKFDKGHMAAAANYEGSKVMKDATVSFILFSFLMLMLFLKTFQIIVEFGKDLKNIQEIC